MLWLEDYLTEHWGVGVGSDSGIVVIVSHDADFLDSVCTNIIHLNNYQLDSYNSSYSQFDKMRHQIEMRNNKIYEHQQKVAKEVKATGNNASLTVEKLERKILQKLDVRMLIEKPRAYKVNFNIHAAEDNGDGSSGISVTGVNFNYPGQPLLFRNLHFRVDSHSRVAIVGANGAGKSTLLHLLMKRLQPNTKGENIKGLDGEIHHDRRLRVGCYHQHFEELLPYDITAASFLVTSYSISMTEVSSNWKILCGRLWLCVIVCV